MILISGSCSIHSVRREDAQILFETFASFRLTGWSIPKWLQVLAPSAAADMQTFNSIDWKEHGL